MRIDFEASDPSYGLQSDDNRQYERGRDGLVLSIGCCQNSIAISHDSMQQVDDRAMH